MLPEFASPCLISAIQTAPTGITNQTFAMLARNRKCTKIGLPPGSDKDDQGSVTEQKSAPTTEENGRE